MELLNIENARDFANDQTRMRYTGVAANADEDITWQSSPQRITTTTR